MAIADGPSNFPIVINASNSIYQWSTSGWNLLPGSGTDIAIGGAGSDSIWVIGTNATGGGYGIYRYSNGGWTGYPGGGVHIAVGPDGNPYVVNDSGQIFHWTGTAWQQLPGSARDIGVASNGALWVVGFDSEPGGSGIYQWNGSGWTAVVGGAARISVPGNGMAVIANSAFDIYQRL